MNVEVTEIVVDAEGTESHESWIAVSANRVQSTGTRLFDSDVNHQQYVVVRVARMTRKRNLNKDWMSESTPLLEMSMSLAQWGAFVSSFGSGTGVPATLTRLLGERVSDPAREQSRLDRNLSEVRDASTKALSAIEAGAGKKVLRAKMNTLRHCVANGPANMEFAASSLATAAEDTVTKARADIEGMVLRQAQHLGIEAGDTVALELTSAS